MGAKLNSYYDIANQMRGLKAKTRLAIITKMPSSAAKDATDSPENVTMFENAMAEIRKEFK